MKQMVWLRSCIFVCILSLGIFSPAKAQVQTAMYDTSISTNTTGFYEYLPQGYDALNISQQFPLLIFLHGFGDVGDGSSNSSTGLPLVKRVGPPHMIDQGHFSNSFTAGSNSFSFIVISPQFSIWPLDPEVEINDIIDYCILNYHVDVNRIYLTGLSMGGGLIRDYAGFNNTNANRVAAVLPVCPAINNADTWPNFVAQGRVIAAANLPVWITHNNDDHTVPVMYTNDLITEINKAPAPNPLAKKTIFTTDYDPFDSHNAWSATYDLSFQEGGKNIFEWMLQYQRNGTPLPVTLSSYSVAVSGPSQVTVSWTTTFESSNEYFSIEHSVDGINFTKVGQVKSTNISSGDKYSFVHKNAVSGVNFYRLSQTDIDTRRVYFDIKKATLSSTADKIHIYPNPVIDQVTLKINNSYSGKLQAKVIDLSGKIIKTFDYSKSNTLFQQVLSLKELPVGQYIIELKGDNYSSSVPFIKN
ncbi:MAG: T9SS type A sorting domain-containing protein [Chitinophagaceae bacterium]